MSATAKTKLASLLVLLSVFVAGGILGAAFDRTLGAEGAPEGDPVSAQPEAETADGDREGDGEGDEERRERRMAMWERTGPDESQRVAIDSIIAHHRQSMRSLQSEFEEAYNPRYWAIVDSTRASIREVLGPDQRMQYDSMTAAYDERRRDRNRWDPND